MFSRFFSLSSFLLVLFPALTRGDFTIDQHDVDFHGGMQYKGSWKRIVCHCGHSNCDGTMTFTMSQSGSFHVCVKGAEWKSQGATQCKLFINGNQVASGEFKDSNGGKCGNSSGDSDFKIINGQTIDLGSHSFQSGDKVKYWSNTAFQCGTSGPGSYSAFTHLEFKGSGTSGPECGNGKCESGETCVSCAQDCGECPAIDAFAKIEAEEYSDQSGTQKESCNEGGESIGYAENGDWLLFKNVDFGKGANTVEARVATKESNGAIDIIIDKLAGTKPGTVEVAGTGGWENWKTVTAKMKDVTGTHDLYLKWTSNSVNLNWIRFAEDTQTRITQADRSIGNDALRLEGATLYLSGRAGAPKTILLHRVNGECIASVATIASVVPLNRVFPAFSSGLYLIIVESGNKRERIKLIGGRDGRVRRGAAVR